MARKFNVGDRVVLSDNALVRLKDHFSGLVGKVVDYASGYDSGYYYVDFGDTANTFHFITYSFLL